MTFVLSFVLGACGAGGEITGSVGGSVMTVVGTEDLAAFGTIGTTFSPDSVTCVVGNSGTAALTWQAVGDVAWVTITPADGVLQPQESITVEVALNQAVHSLPVGVHTGLLDLRNLDNGVGDVSRSVSVTVTSPASLAMSTASRASGVAPLAVTFDATSATSGVVQPPGGSPDFARYGDEWTYGDPNSGTWTHSGKQKNRGTGWIGAHVFETPGSYRVSLRVTADDGTTTDHHQDIVVDDPETVYASRTFHVAANGLDSNPGTAAQPYQTLSRGLAAAFSNNVPTRVLFRRGDSFSTSATHSPGNGTAPVMLGAYGSGAKPVLRMGGTNGGMSLSNWTDVRLVDLHLLATATNMLSYARGVTLGHRTTLLRCTVESFGYGLDASYVNDATVCDCEVLDGVEYGLWAYSADLQLGNRLAVLGTRFDEAGYHLTRVYINRSIFQSNLYQRGGFTAMAWVGRNAGSPPTQLNCILDNTYTTETQDIVAMGPANAQFNEYARDFLFEGNRFTSRVDGGSCLRIRGSRVTIRNNVFDLTGRQAIDVSPWSGSPVPAPSDIRIEHNTCYRGTGSPLRFLTATSANTTHVRNNLLYCRQGTAQTPTGTVTLAQNPTTDPQFVDAPAGDFSLRAISTAVDTAVETMVRTDFLHASRPATATSDVGAFERQE
jgi:hypothetical protein